MKLKTLGIAIIGLVTLVLISAIAFILISRDVKPPVYSARYILNEMWKDYKDEYLEDGTYRTLDKQRNYITTSEGQSYTMLRAVWLDDQETFDRSWQWTKDNLQREDDKLFSWLFGQKEDGSYGIITEQGGQNTASDGDTDIALALIFAYSRWREKEYLDEALLIINDIWEEEVVTINGKPYLAANNVEKESEEKVIINPSYLAPYAYKIFAVLDTKHDWNSLVDTSYELLNLSMENKIDKKYSANLVPDWIIINIKTGDVINNYMGSELTSNYSYDAIRTPWRLALDWLWFKEPKAKETLKKMNFLSQQWNVNKRIFASYSHDGLPLASFESIATYATSIGYFLVVDNLSAKEVYYTKLDELYDYDSGGMKETLSYYDDNWAWFGIAMYYNELPNLAQKLINQ